MSELMKKIQNYSAVIGVIGLGYVGLPLAVEKARAGYKTLGFDVQSEKVDMVNRGENYIGDVAGDDLEAVVKDGRLSATTDFSFIQKVDCVAICVPTPLDEHKQPDVSYVKKSAESVAKYIHKDMLVVLESTTYPGTTEELIKPILEQSGLVCNQDFFLAFSPERVDPGNLIYKTKNTPKVVGGVGKESSEIAAALYRNVLESDVHVVSSPAVAEMEKLLENTYRNVNIALANEMAQLCNKMGINVWDVIDAAKSKPYGFQAFYPGPGVGGHCIPLDPSYLSWKALEYGFHTKLIEVSSQINDGMPDYVVQRASRILNKGKKALNGSKILLLGVAYKQDIDDYRESPALEVMEKLEDEGAEVSFFDPYVSECRHKSRRWKGFSELTEQIVSEIDLVVVTTAHTTVDYTLVSNCAKKILDTKNAMKSETNRSAIEVL